MTAIVFRAVCLAAFGSAGYHELLRLKVAQEVLFIPQYNDNSRADYVDVFNDNRIVLENYDYMLSNVLVLNRPACMHTMAATSCVLGAPIQSYCPPNKGNFFSSDPLTRSVVGRGVRPTLEPAAFVMWSMGYCPKKHDHFRPNHFAFLCRKFGGDDDHAGDDGKRDAKDDDEEGGDGDVKDDDDGGKVDGWVDDDDVGDGWVDDNDDEDGSVDDAAAADDDDDDDGDGKVYDDDDDGDGSVDYDDDGDGSVDHDDDGDGSADDDDNGDGSAEDDETEEELGVSGGRPLHDGRFLNLHVLLESLEEEAAPLQKVPVGEKNDVFFCS